MNLTTDIQKVITEHLPSAVGAELQKRLKAADELERKVEILNNEIEGARKANIELIQEARRMQADLNKHDDLAKREAAVAERERVAELTELRIKLEASEGNTKFARDVALGLVRNTEYRNSVHEETRGKSHGVPGSNGSCGMVLQNHGSPETTTTSTTNQAV